jgi:hypothetical protein
MDCWESTPRIAFLSPERGSGKTRALEVTEPLVPNPVHAVNVSPAYLFRKVSDEEHGLPTILYDEVDNLFDRKAQDTAEVRALLNAGHRKGAVAGRCINVGNVVKTEELPAYCAVAFAGLGNLPDTIASRCVIVDMQRRAPNEKVEPFRLRIHLPQGEDIFDALRGWCASISHKVAGAEPVMPDSVTDRDADCWEPLLAIADAAGGEWPKRARAAAIHLLARDTVRTTGVQLLSDLRDIFFGTERLATATILNRLINLPESPWAEANRGKPINEYGLSSRLRKYGIKPKVIRFGEETARGYAAADMRDAWTRYLPPPQSVTSVTPKHAVTPETEKTAENQGEEGQCYAVTDVTDYGGGGVTVTGRRGNGSAVSHDPFGSLRNPSLRLARTDGDAA